MGVSGNGVLVDAFEGLDQATSFEAPEVEEDTEPSDAGCDGCSGSARPAAPLALLAGLALGVSRRRQGLGRSTRSKVMG